MDLDETLINSANAHIIAYRKAIKKHGYDVSRKKLLKKFGVPAELYIKDLIPNITDSEIESIGKLHDNYLQSTSKKYVSKIRGCLSAIKRLKKSYRLALVTNCNKRNVDLLLKGARLNPKLFDIIVYNKEHLKPKPFPDEIIKAEHLLKLKADFMVGDTTYDIIAARRAKVPCIAVLTGHHSRTKLKKEKPYAILKSIKYLPDFLDATHPLS